jgi:hypothetical protein
VHAEVLVRHSSLTPDALKSILIARFRAEDRNALKNSQIFNSGQWSKNIEYSTESPSYRLFCVPTSFGETQIYVEPVTGNLIEACDSVWRGTKRALKSSSPRLASMKLVDDESKKDIIRADASDLAQELGRRENISPLVVGAAAAIYAVIGVFTFASKNRGEFLAGAVTGLAGAIIALMLAFITARKGRLSWK